MVSLVRIVRFIWFITFIIYFIVVFLCYFQWPSPEPVGVSFSADGQINYAMDKSVFFYAVNAFMIAYNLIFILLHSVVEQIPTAHIPLANKEFWLSSKYNSDYVKHVYSNWIRSLASMLNIIYILWLVMITYANLEQYDMRKPIGSFWFLAPLLLLTVVGWTAFALLRFRYKKILVLDNKIK